MKWLSFQWQDPLGRTVLVRNHGLRVWIGALRIDVWFNYPNKKVVR